MALQDVYAMMYEMPLMEKQGLIRRVSDEKDRQRTPLFLTDQANEFLMGSHVSAEQPSIIDDPTIISGFYGAPTVCIVFAMKNFLYSIPDAFCCAESMVLEATDLGLASCIIARAEATFAGPKGQEYLKRWNIPENYEARCFVLLGYCRGEYPAEKARKDGRCMVVEE